jgi:hypothetical protein
MGSPFDLAQLDKIVSQAREYFFQHVLSCVSCPVLGGRGGEIPPRYSTRPLAPEAIAVILRDPGSAMLQQNLGANLAPTLT